MRDFTIFPVLGLRTNVPYTDPSLFVSVGDSAAMTHCVDCRNIDFTRIRNACSKSEGRAEWSNSAVGTPSYCLGIFELYDGTNRVVWMAYDGDMYRFDSARDPGEIADAGATAFASDQGDLYSFIRYGNHMVFSDYGEHTPYCSDFNDANLVKLISGGTEFKFRYLGSFARRIIGMYSDQSNGNIEIRWSNANPTPNTDCEFAAANQLYVPNDDPITGGSKMGTNAFFVYCENSINRLDYYTNYATPFGFTTTVDGQGFVNHHSIINENGLNYGYNTNYGFCAYDGGRALIPIGTEIENWTKSIRYQYANLIVGASLPYANSLIWTVPLEGSSIPNALLIYDYVERKWTRRDFEATYISRFINATNVTWTKLTTEMGYTTWESLGALRWADLIDETPTIGCSSTDGKLYSLTSESDAGSDYDGYRVEPALSFGGFNTYSILSEIWFSIVYGSSFNLYVYYRGADTEIELRTAKWIALEEVSFNSPKDAVCRLNNSDLTAKRLHQIKWGTDAENEQFVVNQIKFYYDFAGRY